MMEEKRSFLRVGLLLVGGAGLLIGLIWFLGGSEIRNGVLFESYYKESVRGLDVGGVVRYRGVAIGRVTEIGLVTAEYSSDKNAPLDRDIYRLVYVRYMMDRKRMGTLPETEEAVKLGLRSRLASAGLTGVTYIELDFVDPAKFATAPVPWTPKGEYIPSVPTTLSRVEESVQALMDHLSQIDIVRIGTTALATMEDADGLLRDVRQTLKDTDVPKLAEDLRRLLEDPNIGRTVAQSAAASEALTRTVAQLQPLIASVQGVTKRADGSVADTQAAIAPLMRDLSATIANLRDLSDSLRRDPSQVLTAKPPPRRAEDAR